MDYLANLKRWQRVIAPLISGLLLGITQPLVVGALKDTPLDETGLSSFFVFFAYIPVFLVAKQVPVKRAFWFGFFTSLIQYVIILYWFVIAMTVFGQISIWFSSFVLLIACAILASYIGTAFAISQYLQHRFAWSFFYTIPFALCSVEYLRNYIFLGGFPWGASGYALASIPIFLQSASLVGIYGMVFYVVLVNAALASLFFAYMKKQELVPYLMSIAVVITVIFLIYGGVRLNNFETNNLKSIHVALLQGNIEQGIKNNANFYAHDILQKYERLQKEAYKKPVDLLIWPEASFPFQVGDKNQTLPKLFPLSSAAIIGGVAYERGLDEKTKQFNLFFYNTAFLLKPDLKIMGRFDKNHLVPFGEYVPWPFEKVANKVVPGLGVFKRGEAFKPLWVDFSQNLSVPVGVTICYEGVFPEISRDFVKGGAEFLVNVTNDAWYGVSSAPYQHLNMYKVRAVETGRTYVRATNTGVSGIIDARGQLTDRTPLYEEAVVNSKVYLSQEKTPYLMLGDVVGYLSVVFILLALMLGLVGKNVFLKKRSKLEWVLGIFGFGLAIWSQWYFSEAKMTWDESAFTKDTFVTAFGLIVGTASLCGKAWGKTALLWAGALATILCALIAYFEGLVYGVGSLAGLAIFLLIYKRPLNRN